MFDFMARLGPRRLLESPVFTAEGGDVPIERTIAEVSGWRGSRPVRVGNDASGQVQHDVLGIVVEAVTAFDELGAGLRRAHLAIVRAFADRAVPEPGATNGIWELRQPGRVVSADIGRWVALDRAAALAGRHRRWRWSVRARRWRRTRDKVRTTVVSALRPDGSLPHAYDDGPTTHDASALLAIVYGLLEPNDPRAHALVDATLRGLSDGPFLRRYVGVDDGFAPGEGAFLPSSWWAVSALSILGRKDEALARAEAMRSALPGIQPEEFDVASGTGLGNAPLVWAHTEAARAVILLDRA
jgi:GH15 family glucan-1,4-alpha-glucosidase